MQPMQPLNSNQGVIKLLTKLVLSKGEPLRVRIEEATEFIARTGQEAGIDFNKHRKVYPELGRKLTAQDIGKVVFRVFPYLNPNAFARIRYDWSYMDCAAIHGKAHGAQRLKSLNNGVEFDDQMFPVCSLPNDEYWTTADEFNQYEKQNPECGIPFSKVDFFNGYPDKSTDKKEAKKP